MYRTAAVGVALGLAVSLVAPVAEVAQAAYDSDPKIAVMPLKARRLSEEVVEILDYLLVSSVAGSGKFHVIGADEIKSVLALEGLKDNLGCDDVTCMAEIGGALNARYSLQGSVGKLGDEVVISLTLFDNNTVKVAARSTLSLPNDENYFKAGITNAVAELLGLKATETTASTQLEIKPNPAPATVANRRGSGRFFSTQPQPRLVVTSSPLAAHVFINDKWFGVTPIDADIDAGKIDLHVEKNGYSAFHRAVAAKEGKTLEFTANLMSITEARSRRSSRLTLGLVATIGSLVLIVPTAFLFKMAADSGRDALGEKLGGILGGVGLLTMTLTFLPIGLVLLASLPEIPRGGKHLDLVPKGGDMTSARGMSIRGAMLTYGRSF